MSYPVLGFDPAPGRPAQIGSLADEIGRGARHLQEATDRLAQVRRGTGFWEGEAAVAFCSRLGELPGQLGTATEALHTAEHALRRWRNDLDDLQARARELERAAAAADADVHRAATRVHSLPHPTGADPVRDEQLRHDLDVARRQLHRAQELLDDVERRAHRLLEEHHHTAQDVARSLRHAGHLAPHAPGLLHRITSAVSAACDWVTELPGKVKEWCERNAEALKHIGDVLSTIGTALAVAGLVCAAIPPLEVLTPFLEAGAAAMSLGALVTHGLAKVGGAEVSWWEIGSDALGVATFGAGRIAGKVANRSIATGRALIAAGRTAEIGPYLETVVKMRKIQAVVKEVDDVNTYREATGKVLQVVELGSKALVHKTTPMAPSPFLGGPFLLAIKGPG